MIILWNFRTPLSLMASLMWFISEYFHLPLGRFAPRIFGWMIGATPNPPESE